MRPRATLRRRRVFGWAFVLVAAACAAPATGPRTAQSDRCRQVLLEELQRAPQAPVQLYSEDAGCRTAMAGLEAREDVVMLERLRPRRCPGRWCGPARGTIVRVEPDPASDCFGVWAYFGTGGAHHRVCRGPEGQRRIEMPVVVY